MEKWWILFLKIIILSASSAPQTTNLCGDKQRWPKQEQVLLIDSKSEPPPLPAFGGLRQRQEKGWESVMVVKGEGLSWRKLVAVRKLEAR